MSSQEKPKLQASSNYRFARNPKAAIVKAIKDAAEQKSSNVRLCWKALIEAAAAASRAPGAAVGGAPATSLSCEAFSGALKGFGTGIQLTGTDVAIAFGSEEDITFSKFQSFLA
eukprot:INCI11911.1.p2 GENE.INCI11911.1~~INCI11911.1.p2  ORF type:complete len:114 (+),score=29.30 INCI11911.1:117-458(+)